MGSVVTTGSTAGRIEPIARPSPIPYQRLAWAIDAKCPSGWRRKLEQCGGGFFHTPTALHTLLARGEPLFAQLFHGGEVVGAAAGVRIGCGLSLSAHRHVYFPTTPAIALPSRRDEALEELVEMLRRHGAAEVEFDSLDAGFEPQLGAGAELVALRMEYRVILDRCIESMRRRLSAEHLRCVRRGEDERWVLTIVSGADTNGALAISGAGGWGTSSFTAAAWRGDLQLAQAKVGLFGSSAYCLRSLSCQAGRTSGAPIWLQWRIICELAERGLGVYNLGGTPAEQGDESLRACDPLRFRLGFAPEMFHCRRVRWTLSHAHLRAHRLLPWLAIARSA